MAGPATGAPDQKPLNSSPRRSGRRRVVGLQVKAAVGLAALFVAGVVAAGALGGSANVLELFTTGTDTAATEPTTGSSPDTSTVPTEAITSEAAATETTEPAATEPVTTETAPPETVAASGPPSIASDKDDYAPGEAVNLSGENWQPGESVHIFVNDDEGQSWSRNVDVTATAEGTFRDDFQLPNWFVANFSVKATGPQSGTATTAFTDAVVGGIISWEKRSQNGGGLVGGATFTVGGSTGPFACSGNSTNPVTVIDNGALDGAGGNGVFQLVNVCPGSYTVTETVPPTSHLLDPDPTRDVTVNSSTPNITIGAQGSAQECPDADPATDGDLTADFCDPALGNISWEKRRQDGGGGGGDLRVGATFTVGGASGPFACKGDATNPVTILDDGTLDADADDGQFTLENVCAGTYTVTETLAPAGFGPDPDPTRSVTVSASAEVIGTQGNKDDCPDSVPATDTDEADFCNPPVGARNLDWEKRSQTTGALAGGATFIVGGTTGPLACGGNTANPVTVVDNGALDADPDAGQFRLVVCDSATPYTVTETVAPPGFSLDPDPTRSVTVNGSNISIGAMGTAQECPDAVPATDSDTNADFCNPAVATRSISWEKRRHDGGGGGGGTQGGATFTVGGASGPFACAGVTTNPVIVVDDGILDVDPDPGQLTLANVCDSQTYTITETVAPSGFATDPDPTRSVTLSGSDVVIGTSSPSTKDDCPDAAPATDSDTTSDFCNPPLATISWEKRNQSGGGFVGLATFTVGGTAGPFACSGTATNPVTITDNDSLDQDNTAGQIQLQDVCPGTYTITETVAPLGFSPDADPTRSVTVSGSGADVSIGGEGNMDDCPDAAPATDSDTTSDFCNSSVTTRSISWEKRDQNGGGLLGGATFTVGGTTGPFACRGDTTNPVTVVDNGSLDTDIDAGQFTLANVCDSANPYTVTETIAPGSHFLEPDPTRSVTVNGASVTIGTQGTAQDCPDADAANDGDTTADFCDPQVIVGSISWEKRKHADGTLQGGATFTVGGTSGPFSCFGNTTNPVTVVDNGTNDFSATAGVLVLENVCSGTYTVTETVAPSTFIVDPDNTRSVTVDATGSPEVIGTQGTANGSCPDASPGTDTDEDDFCNPAASAVFNVSKDFSDKPSTDTTNVTVSLDCAGNGTVVVNDSTASEADAANFTVTGFTGDPTCTATESPIPTGYTGSGSPAGTCAALLSAGTCTITNTRQTGTIEVVKDLIPSTDPGLFDLQINGVTDTGADNVGNGGTTGAETVNTGLNNVGEVAGTGTSLSDYASSISCEDEDAQTASSTGTGPLSFTVEVGDAWVCTITNTRKATIELRKDWVGTAGNVTLKIGTTVGGSEVDSEALVGTDGTTGPNTVDTGDYYVSETFDTPTNAGDYAVSVSCFLDLDDNGIQDGGEQGGPPDGNGSFPVFPGNDIVCTITNTLDIGTIELRKDFVGTAGNVTLNIGTSADGAEVDTEVLTGSDGTTGATTVNSGTFYLSESFDSPSSSSQYTTSLSCFNDLDNNGNDDTEPAVTPGTSDEVVVGGGDHVICTFTNTRETASVELRKDWVGTAGNVTLKIGTTVGGSEVDSEALVGTDGTTGPNTVDTGDYYVSETFDTPTNAGDYAVSTFCFLDLDDNGIQDGGEQGGPPDGNGSFPVFPGNDIVCTITNTLDIGTIELRKDFVGTAGNVTLNIGTSADGAEVDTEVLTGSDGTTGATTVNSGTFYLSESFDSPSSSSQYTTSLSCFNDLDNNGNDDTEPAVTPGTSDEVVVGGGDHVICTFTNTRETASVELRKDWVGTAGNVTLKIGTTAGGSQVDSEALVGTDGTTGPNTVDTGDYYVSETFDTPANAGDYAVSTFCFLDLDDNGIQDGGEQGGPPDGNGSFPVFPGNDIVCTITNTRQTGTVEVVKDLVPSTDPGVFDLQVNGSTEATDQTDGGTTGAVAVNTGTNTIGEAAGSGTFLSDYTNKAECVDDGGAGSVVASEDPLVGSLDVSVNESDQIVCTITNTRNTGLLTVTKDLVPSTDPGLFNLQINGTTDPDATDIGDGGSTGAETVNTGTNTIGETAGTSTSLGDYTSSAECVDQGGSGTIVASEDPLVGSLDVGIASGDDIVCTITNSRQTGTITITKDVSPDADPGVFDLEIDSAVAGTGNDAGDGDSTGAVAVNTGNHTVSESAGTATSLGDYTSSISCTEDTNPASPLSTSTAGPLTIPVANGDAWTCTITNTRQTGTVEVVKDLVPSTDPGVFDLQVNGSTEATDQTDGGTTGAVAVNTGTNTIGEAAGSGTFLSDYTNKAECVDDGGAGSVVASEDPLVGSLDVSVNESDQIVCTITNTRNTGLLTVTKDLVPSTDPGLFNLQINGTTDPDATDIGDGGSTGAETVNTGTNTIGETAGTSTSLGDYTSSAECVDQGGSGTIVASEDPLVGSLDVGIASGDDIVCTITNSRQTGTITITKDVSPDADPGVFDLEIDSAVAGTGNDAGDGDSTGAVAVNTGNHTVSESAGTATSLGDYTSSISCTEDTNPASPLSTSTAGPLTIPVANGDAWTCTITNTRNTGLLTVTKDLVPSTDPGLFNLQINGTTDPDATDIGDGGSTGAETVNTGTNTIGETAGTSTSLGDYTSSAECVDQGGSGTIVASEDPLVGSLDVGIASGDDIVCTITNSRQTGTITITKDVSPDADPGVFDLEIDSAVAGTGNDAGDGDSTGAVAVNTGNHTVSESAGTATSLGDYTSSISCTEDTNPASPLSTSTAGPLTIPVADGDAWTCTITNSRQTGTITITKDVSPDADPGVFDLEIDSAVAGTGNDAGDGDSTGAVAVNTGNHTVSESAGTATSLGDYTSSISCTEDTNPASPLSTSTAGPLTIPVANGDAWTCTITNTRQTGTVEVVKDLVPSTDPGVFDLQVNGSTEATDQTDGGTTGAVAVNTGTNTIGEAAGSGTFLSDYTNKAECVDDGGAGSVVASEDPLVGSLDVSVNESDQIVCTITNTRNTGLLTVTKDLVPSTDPGLFNLQINGTTDPDATDIGDGGSTGAETVNTGTNTIGETAGTSTSLGDYTSSAECVDQGGSGTIVASEDPLVGSLDVGIASGDDIVCTITNSRQTGTITITKDVSPDADPGVFDLEIDSAVAGTGNDAGDGDSTGAVAVNTGNHTVSESAGTATSLGDYTSSISCTEDTNPASPLSTSTAGPLTIPVANGDAWTCTITNTRQTGTVEVVKDLVPSTDPGVFDLQVNGSTEATDQTDGGTTGAVAVNTGTNTIGEAAGSGTFLSDYTNKAECVDDGGAGSVVASEDPLVGSLDVSVNESDQIVCTITNTRNTGLLTVTKDLVPSTDPGLFNLQINGTTDPDATDIGDGGSTGAETVNTGTNTIGETAGTSTSLGDYTSSAECVDQGGSGTIVASEDPLVGSLDVGIASGDDIVCTITNSRQTGTITITKDVSPDADPGVFDLEIDSAVAGTGNDAGDGDSTGAVAVNTGNHTVSESAGTATSLGDYTSSISCTEDTNPASPLSTSTAGPLTIPVANGDAWTCTITNTRNTGLLTVTKDLVPSTDPGLFNLQINGTTDPDATDIGDGGSTGAETVNTGTNTIGETAGTSTSLGDYTSSAECVDQGGSGTIVASEDPLVGSLDVGIASGDDIVCTITNSRQTGTITITKDVSPDADPGVFDLEIDSAVAGTGNDAGDGDSTGAVAVNTGNHTVSESAGTATSLGDYTSSISCTEDTNPASPLSTSTAGPLTIPVADGDAWTCTITNSRQTGTITITKDVSPDADPGVFDLEIDSAVAGTGNDAGDGDSTGAVAVNTGNHTVSESAGTATSLGDYTSSISCTEDTNPASPLSTSTAGPLTIPVANGDAWTCTITNTTTTATFTVKKDFSDKPSTDTTTVSVTLDCGGNGTVTGNPQLASEATPAVFTVTGFGDDPLPLCKATESPVPTGYSGSGTPEGTCQASLLPTGECTITNTRQTGTIELKKVWSGTAGNVTLKIGTTAGGAEVDSQPVSGGPGTTGPSTVSTGTYFMSETFNSPTNAADYTKVLACFDDENNNGANNSEPAVSVGATGNVSVGAGDHVICTFTNTFAGGAPPTCDGSTATIVGAPGNTTINGTNGNDVIVDLTGNNRVFSLGGNDKICLGDGDDYVEAGTGNDTVNAGNGKNKVYGEAGNDNITSGTGDDTIYGGPGNNTVNAGEGNNYIETGSGTDQITAGAGNDKAYGGGGVDTIQLGNGTNYVQAGDGNDQITTGSGDDLIYAEAGNDTVQAGDGKNKVFGEGGDDNITSGTGDDTIDGGPGNNTVNAGDGKNYVETGSGVDKITTGSGDDTIFSGSGNDTILAGEGKNHVDAGPGSDKITTGSGPDTILGGSGSDTCTPGGGANSVTGCEVIL